MKISLKTTHLFSLALILMSVNSFAATFSDVQTSREKQIESIRNEEIHTVKSALSLRSPENRKAELYLRLAELYLESYRADFLLEGRIHEETLKTNPNAHMEHPRSVDDLKYGIGAAEQILSLHQDEKKMDKVYYFLGYNYGELGYAKKSLEYYKKLSKNYPDSPFAVEGLKAAADEDFGAGRYPEAQQEYEQALGKTKEASQQARLYHKLAWCYYRQRRTNDAIDAMKKAIAIAQTDNEKLFNVREEGLRDIAVYYAESGRVDEAIAYFKANAGGEDKLASVLEKLGKEYERTGQTEKAEKVYDVLLKLGGKDESTFRTAVKLIDLDINKQNYESAYRRLQVVVLPKSTDPDSNLAMSNLRRMVRGTAITNQDRYRKLVDKTDDRSEDPKKYLHIADEFYSIYLVKFIAKDDTGKPERNEIRMYLAEAKRDLGEPGDAAILYKKIIQDADPKYASQAAQLWVGSLAAELKKKADSGEKPGADLSQIETDFIEASDMLEKSIPDSTESREARLRSAQILAAYPAHKSEAIARASKLTQDSPSTPQGLLAARLWLQLAPEKGTLEAIQKEAALQDQDRKSKGELGKATDALTTDLRVKEISSLEKNKDYVKAAKGYEEFAHSAKTEKEADNAYLGAMTAYAENGSSEEVYRVMKEWKSKYPKSKVVEKSVKEQATQFFIRGLFNDSAELFLGIGRQFRDFNSFLTSAALFDGGLQHQKARDVYKLSITLAPNDEERAKVYRSSAQVASDMKDDLGSFNDWKSCYALNTSLKAECGSEVGNYYLRLSDSRQGKAVFEEVVAIKKGPSSKSPYLAYAQFRQAQILEREMKNPPLSFPDEVLLKAFTQRVEELKPVSNAYQKAIELGGPWGIAATERLGDLALGLSNEVTEILKDPKAKDNLKAALTPVAQALRAKALDNSKTAYNLAVRNEILSPALPVIQDRLVEAKIGGMQRAQGPRLGVKLIGMSPDGGKDGPTASLKSVRDRLLANQSDALSWIDYGNLLWGTGKPGLSKVAYQRALDSKTRQADAMNNLAVVLVSDQGFENWFAANEAVALWKKALGYETTNSAALYNLGHYFNYFRLFEPAVSYFNKAARKVNVPEIHDEMGVAYYGVGKNAESDLEMKEAVTEGLKDNRFTAKYIEAGRAANRSDCTDRLNEISNAKDLRGFEKISYERMKLRCLK
jgi:tetratricopeptide (TPR) repeat protein